MLKIFLARHGQDIDNANKVLSGHRNMPLTDAGIEQVLTLAQDIKQIGINFEKIYTSPLLRAKETAEILARKMNVAEPEVLRDLIERDFGPSSGRNIASVLQEHQKDILSSPGENYIINLEGAETFPNILTRGRHVIGFVKTHHRDGNILLVTHGDIGKMIYAAYYNLDWKKVLVAFYFGNADLLELSEDAEILVP